MASYSDNSNQQQTAGLIRLDDVTKVYNMGKVQVHALRGISLAIDKGEMIAIIGSSGSGKSTLMNIMGCLDKPSSGKYVLDGKDIAKLNDNQLAELRSKKFGFVFQDFNLISRASAIANVELPLIYGGNMRRHGRAMEALERVGLGGRAKHKPTELSGGEQQRVAIARALVNSPDLILADEPTGNLDSRVTEEIISIFHDLNKEGITIILVTHEMDIAKQAKRILRISDGQIVSDARAQADGTFAEMRGGTR